MPASKKRKSKAQSAKQAPQELPKTKTGISGFDSITNGGLPTGRPTLVCGSAGCGKSLFATEFLIRGALYHNEPGVLMTFEETAEDIAKNVASLGFDVEKLVADKKLVIDHVRVERAEIDENGEYDLEGIFIRLDYAIKSVGAKRVVLDTIETLFSGLSNEGILRAELRRLFGWLKERNMTTIITGERGDGQLTRQGLEEYVSDCVVLLDHRVEQGVSTRRLRVVKYRGALHGTNEYPFLIDETGITVLPVTGTSLDYSVSDERISSGVPELDDMLGGKGFYRSSSILLTGTAGTGKSSVAAAFANAACKRGERCLYFSFEESPHQIVRNFKTVGLNLGQHVKNGLLKIHSTRPTTFGLETHLAQMHKLVLDFDPQVVVVDPISNLRDAGNLVDSTIMLIRLIDFLRQRRVTAFMVSLTKGDGALEATDENVSSTVDAWLLLRDIEIGGERNRAMYVLKARGMSHSNQVREFVITSKGISLLPVYLGPAGVLTGSARIIQEANDEAQRRRAEESLERQRLALAQRRRAMDAQIAVLEAEFASQQEEYETQARRENERRELNELTRSELQKSRKA